MIAPLIRRSVLLLLLLLLAAGAPAAADDMVRVGSKRFTESYLLDELITQSL